MSKAFSSYQTSGQLIPNEIEDFFSPEGHDVPHRTYLRPSRSFPQAYEFPVPSMYNTGLSTGISSTAIFSNPSSSQVDGFGREAAVESEIGGSAPVTPEFQRSVTPEDEDQNDGRFGQEFEDANESNEGYSNPPREKTVAERLAEKRRMRRFRLNQSQTRYLLSEFARQPNPDAAQRVELAKGIPGITPRQVQVWFQNKRAKFKRLHTDSDRDTLQQSLKLPTSFDPTRILRPELHQQYPPHQRTVQSPSCSVSPNPYIPVLSRTDQASPAYPQATIGITAASDQLWDYIPGTVQQSKEHSASPPKDSSVQTHAANASPTFHFEGKGYSASKSEKASPRLSQASPWPPSQQPATNFGSGIGPHAMASTNFHTVLAQEASPELQTGHFVPPPNFLRFDSNIDTYGSLQVSSMGLPSTQAQFPETFERSMLQASQAMGFSPQPEQYDAPNMAHIYPLSTGPFTHSSRRSTLQGDPSPSDTISHIYPSPTSTLSHEQHSASLYPSVLSPSGGIQRSGSSASISMGTKRRRDESEDGWAPESEPSWLSDSSRKRSQTLPGERR